MRAPRKTKVTLAVVGLKLGRFRFEFALPATITCVARRGDPLVMDVGFWAPRARLVLWLVRLAARLGVPVEVAP